MNRLAAEKLTNTANTRRYMRYETMKHPDSEHKYILLDNDDEIAQEGEVLGHWVYIRLCERAEDAGGIILPQKSRDEHTTLYEVIAVGRKVSAFREKDRRFKGVPYMDCNSILDIRVGDTVIIPEKATSDSSGYEEFIKRSCISEYEGLIDKGLILSKVS